MPESILQYGIAGVAIGGMIWLVKAFLAHLKNKDTLFTETINNHMKHAEESHTKQEASNLALADAINRIIDKKL